ncbi:hypothetical protein AMS68_003075 [Peltaster fructicola]|uniref:Uncharacterized protein n=1 Tax=Peltaster fructicola TaxID=286661 RepID=A0A6H0XSF9_9PEZI|nr:hypothetical protein AMS68_003075 [Peltaster fructicola]
MSGLRAHFSSVNSQRSAKSTQPSITKAPSDDGFTRQPSKLAKKGSKLPTAPRATQGRPVNPTSSMPATQPRSKTTMTAAANANTTLTQLRDQMQASEPYRDILLPPHILRTPSLVSGSSISTVESPRSNVLRRKPSTIGKFVATKRSEALEHERSITHSRNDDYTETMDDSVFGIAMPYNGTPASNTPYSLAHSDSLYTTAGTNISNTPSTRYTDSPFSHVPTPSSFSSQSTMPMAARDGSKLSREVSRHAVMSPVEAMRQEKASRRTSMIPARDSSSRVTCTGDTLVTSGKTQYRGNAAQINGEAVSRASTRRSVNPPELAHLNTLSPKKQSGPARPSRDGAPPLNIASPASPIVQSELPSASFHRRTSSRDSIASSASQGFRSRLGLSPKPSSDRGSPGMGRIMSPTDSDAGSITASGEHKSRPDGHKPSTPTPAASPALGKTRTFGFLSRKSKDETTKLEKPKREARKMPSAGTGHERYGRFGFGHRNGSVSPSVGGRSPSTDSLSSTKSSSFLRRKSSGASDKASELDQFLRDRLSPVVLRGSGTHSSNTSLPLSNTSSTTPGQPIDSALGLVTSASHSSPSRVDAALSPQTSQGMSSASVSATSGSAVGKPHGSHNEPEEILEMLDGKEGMWLRSPIEPKKAARKWNFLQRLQSSPAKSRQAGGMANFSIVDLHRTNFDNAAHSALMDAIEPIDLIEVEKLVLEDDLTSPMARTEN